jgi:hypothetical protein
MSETPSAAAAALDAWSQARQLASRLERIRAQVGVVQEAVSALNGLILEAVEEQQRAVDERSAPLEARVRTEYGEICRRLETAREAYDKIAVGLDEAIRRHAEGRMDDIAFARSQRASEEALRTRAAELATLEQLHARFLAEVEDLPATPAAPATPGRTARPGSLPSPATPAPAVAAAKGTGSSPNIIRIAPDRDLGESTEEDLDSPSGDVLTAFAPPRASGAASGPHARASSPSTPIPAALIDTDDLDIAPGGDAGLPASGTLARKALLVEAHSNSSGVAHVIGDTLLIGRAIDNGLRILDPSVSRQHAAVTLVADEFVIEDRHSQNGTFVNGERIGRHALRDGDRIGIGEAEFVFRLSADPQDTPVDGTPLS